jgi:opacity protein-like surface antigen
MKRVAFGTVACAAALVAAGSAASAPQTTNMPAIFTIKVTITDRSIAMTPNHAARGSTVTFILTNRGKKTHTFQIGEAKSGVGHGFRQTLKPNGQYTKVMYMDYRGVMKIILRSGTTVAAKSSFKIT